jgi:pyridinium-3,5-biscarboxylic acid mononucleotide sulfurtransferase
VSSEDGARRSKLTRLHQLLGGLDSAVVAFSGGVDSSFLAFMAHQALGNRSLAVTADSASLARSELREACAFTRRFAIRHRVVATTEQDDERYVRNGPDRCFFCKTALMDVLEALRVAAGTSEILVGVNLDDLGDHRPGQEAVATRGGRWPLVEVGLSKADIRLLSRELGLPTWNKPSMACLASRIAYGVPVTRAALRRVEAAEEALRGLGLTGDVRVRDQGRDLARIEASPEWFGLVLERRHEVIDELRGAGFRYVTLDLEGYRQGSHNAALGTAQLLQVRLGAAR